jgi:diadenosine tetraphosphate (Ap4A) HIT family hydrolase
MLQVFPFLKAISRWDAEDKVPPWDQVLFESDNFVVVPTVGAIVEGWVLIVPREPYLCMGAINAELREELQQVVALFAAAIRDCYGEVAAFEHGPSCVGTRVGCGVDHAHLHLLPAPRNLIADVDNVASANLSWHLADGLAATADYFRAGIPYLFVEQPIGCSMIADARQAPSQLFRRVVAYQVGSPEKFDWRGDAMESNVVSTSETLSQWLAANPFRAGSVGACVAP